MTEHEKPTIIERLAQGVMQQALGAVTKSAERFIKRAIRIVAMVLAGVAIVVVGIAFLALGLVKWFANLMPSWLAWLIVGMSPFPDRTCSGIGRLGYFTQLKISIT